MPRYSLASYSIRVKKKYEDTFLILNDIGNDNKGNGIDLLIVLDQYFKQLSNDMSHDKDEKKLLRIKTYNKDQTDRIIKGVIETGEYGYKDILYDVDQDKSSYTIKTSEAPLKPFYFSVHLPQDQDKGILILQRFKQFGIRKILMYDFQNYFSKIYPDLSVQIKPLVSSKVLDEYMKSGELKKIRFRSFNLSRDFITFRRDHELKEEDGYLEVVVHAKRNKSIPILGSLHKFLNGDITMSEIVEIQNFEPRDIKLQIDFGGNKKTVDLADLNKIRSYYDISSKIKLDRKTGYPTFSSLDSQGNDLMDDLKKQVFRDTNNVREN